MPTVSPGQSAKYEVLYESCQSYDPSVCQMQGTGQVDLDYATLEVLEISGTSVTLELVTVYKNGTTTPEGALVDVDTGASNITGITGTPTNYFVLAGGLSAPDPIWNTNDAPSFNQTVTETVLGVSRYVNFLNHTSSMSYQGFSFSTSLGFAFDQEYGVFIEIAFSYSTVSPLGNTDLKFAIGMVDNNIWLGSSQADFSLDANPTTINTSQGSQGTSTITITRTNGFSATVTLSATSSSNALACSLTPSSLPATGSDSSTLSCEGSPGTYTVEVNADGGYTTHHKSIVVNVASVNAPDFSLSNSGSISFQTGSSGSTTITLTALNEFSSDTSLQVSGTPSSLTCSLDKSILAGSGTATLTCTGQPGTYTVTVTATSGSTSHSSQVNVQVNSATVPSQPDNQANLILYAAIGVAAAIIALVAFQFLRRRASVPPNIPTETSTPATQA